LPEQEANLPSLRANVFGHASSLLQRAAERVNPSLTGVDRFEAAQAPQQRGLARAGSP
jgi:hypothetical protein